MIFLTANRMAHFEIPHHFSHDINGKWCAAIDCPFWFGIDELKQNHDKCEQHKMGSTKHLNDHIDWIYLPEHACGGNGNISVVELFRRATAQPNDCGLKLRSCCMKSEHSMRATSAKCKSHKIWFLKRRARLWFCPDKFMPHELQRKHSSW